MSKFKGELLIETANIKPMCIKIGLFGEIGSGKSTSAAITAIALADEKSPIGFIDGEASRGPIAVDLACELAANYYGKPKDSFKSRFKFIHIGPPFHPLRVVAAGNLLVESGCSVIIYDILTQAWDSAGGYLDLKEEKIDEMTGGREELRDRYLQAAAAHVKPFTHTKLVHHVEQLGVNAVLVFQAKRKWNPTTKKLSDYDTPIQESGITRTAIAVGRVYAKDENGFAQGGFCQFVGVPGCTKYTHPALLKLLPNDEQLSFKHIEAVKKWVQNPNFDVAQEKPASTPQVQPESPVMNDEKKQLMAKLWKMCANIRGPEKNWLKVEEFLVKNKITDKKVVNLTVEELKVVIDKTDIILNEN